MISGIWYVAEVCRYSDHFEISTSHEWRLW